MVEEEVKVTIFRYDPERDVKPRYEFFRVPYREDLTILGVLRYIYEEYDGSLAFNYECRFGVCGLCAVKVNGRPILACKTMAQREMVIEPLSNLPVIRDLVADRSGFSKAIMRIRPFLERVTPPKTEPEKLKPRNFETYTGACRCTRCLNCLSVCPPASAARNEYSGPAVMVELSKYMFDPRDEG
nr:2Fe-2S iron-sulfur cluster binding domain-containing protein [Nitrososphaeria archaeon]